MTRRFAKYALYALAAAIIYDMQRHRRMSKKQAREALMTWEAEGGALPARE